MNSRFHRSHKLGGRFRFFFFLFVLHIDYHRQVVVGFITFLQLEFELLLLRFLELAQVDPGPAAASQVLPSLLLQSLPTTRRRELLGAVDLVRLVL